MDDALSGLLHDVRPHGAVFDQSLLRPPWSLQVAEGAPLTLLTLMSGAGWVVPDGADPARLRPGEIALVTGPAPYVLTDDLDRPPSGVLHDADLCTTPAGQRLTGPVDMCSHGLAVDGSVSLLKGTYQVEGSVSERVITALPRLVVIPATAGPNPALGMIAAELVAGRPGRQVVLDRLLDLLLVSTLRDWFDRPESGAPAWYRAYEDSVVGPALRLIHDRPAQPWTVASLAAEVGLSRAAFARRFTDQMGEPPVSYLTCWRMCLAADLLRTSDATVGAVARLVGYADAYALSVAFKRAYGIRPGEHRRATRSQVAGL